MTEIKNETYNFSLHIPHQKSMRFLRYRQFTLERDIISIAYSVFNIEKLLKQGHDISGLVLTMDNSTYRNINVNALKKELEDLLIQVLFNKTEVIINNKNLTKNKKRKKIQFETSKNVCLFSGGIDSFSGIFNAKQYFKDVKGVFIAHSDQQGVINITNKIINNVLVPNQIGCETIYAPSIGSEGYSQTRGFLYFLSASIYLNIFDSSNLLITECGSTMYQPRFSPYDEVTMTTHPIIMNKVKKIIEIMLNRKINIITPFENLTKAEVISNSPIKKYIPNTHSCISQRFREHDGTCFGCVIRKIGTICADIQDVSYSNDPFINNSANIDNLLSLMRFNFDIITNYNKMPFFSKENIFLFDKIDLFKRYSLDTYSALYLLEKNGEPLASRIEGLLTQMKKILGEEKLIKRIKNIRENRIKPNFNNIVK